MAIQVIYRGNIALCQDILVQARRIQQASKDAASAMLFETRQTAAAHIRRLRQRARAAGLKAGSRTNQFELSTKICELNELYRENLRKANYECLEIALGIAKQIIGEELSEKSELLAKRIDLAIEGLAIKSQITIAINSKDAETVADSLVALKQRHNLDYISKNTITEGTSESNSAEGSVTIYWRDHFCSIEQALRTTLAHLVKPEVNNA